MSAVRGDRPAWRQHAGFPLQPPSRPRGGEDPEGSSPLVAAGISLLPFLLCPPLTHNDILESYDMLLKEECGINAQTTPLDLAVAADVAR